MSVTIKDIAKLAKVSHTTVSRALNNSPLINQETKEKIQDLAEQLNYTPNFNAKSLVLHRSYNIGLFFSTLNTGTSAVFFYEAVKGVNSVIKDEYNLVVKGIDDYQDFHGITSRSFDGIIVMSQSTADNSFIENVLSKEIPLVVMNRKIDYDLVINILSDDYKGAFKAVQFLIDQGHRHIAHIEGKQSFYSTQERSKGYLDALRRNSIEPVDDYRVQGKYDLESGYEAMNRLLELPELPTAVFCSNDEMAVGAVKAMAEKGLKVPGDISVAGFDDNVFSGFVSPALTTVKRPIEQISTRSAQKLLECIGNKLTSKEVIYMNTELMIRQSVKKIT